MPASASSAASTGAARSGRSTLATQLLLEIAGGSAGPVTTAELADELPRIRPVHLRSRQLQRLLGASVAAADVEQRLRALGMGVRPEQAGWSVQPPSWRFDIEIEADLIEEVVRIGGLDSIEERAPVMAIVPRSPAGGEVDERVVHAHAGGARLPGGHHLRLRRSGTAAAAVRRAAGDERSNWPIRSRPILPVMRGSLLAGPDRAWRARICGASSSACGCSRSPIGSWPTPPRLARFASRRCWPVSRSASRLPEQWGACRDAGGFLRHQGRSVGPAGTGRVGRGVLIRAGGSRLPAPGTRARIVRDGSEIGCLGELHPRLVRALELTYAPLLFEVDYLAAFRANLAQFREVSRFPQIRRDISFTVPVDVAFAALSERVSVAAGSLLKQLSAFDVYQGKGVELGRKSIALGLILQDLSRTLTDE